MQVDSSASFGATEYQALKVKDDKGPSFNGRRWFFCFSFVASESKDTDRMQPVFTCRYCKRAKAKPKLFFILVHAGVANSLLLVCNRKLGIFSNFCEEKLPASETHKLSEQLQRVKEAFLFAQYSFSIYYVSFSSMNSY